jgi:23S rRNA (cytosine1962-C5)-methyltransferase
MHRLKEHVILKRGREESLRRRHPWLFSGAVAQVNGNPASGATVAVLSADGEVQGYGAWSPHSQLRVRMWTFGEGEVSMHALLARRLREAIRFRHAVIDGQQSDAVRLVFSESDGIPGLVVDCYAEWLVCQFHSAGVDHWREYILRELHDLFPEKKIYDRSDDDIRRLEGLEPSAGDIGDGTPFDPVKIYEADRQLLVDIVHGHKTGMYIDQRDNRTLLSGVSKGKSLLNCFSYTGGFAVAALRGGAQSVMDIDSSADALDLGRRNVNMQGPLADRYQQQQQDVFSFLRTCRDSRMSFDIIVLDPPKFAASASAVERAARGYKDINLLAFKLLRPGGLLFTFSCSGHITPSLFRKIVADAAADAGVQALVARELGQSPDHPVSLSIPESLYLKGLLCRKQQDDGYEETPHTLDG